MPTPADIAKIIADESLQHGERWLLVYAVAVLAILLALAVAVFGRYLFGQIKALSTRLDGVEKQFNDHLKDGNTLMVRALDRSSVVLERVEKMLEHIGHPHPHSPLAPNRPHKAH